MRKILADRKLQLTKSLGQNFLHDGNQLRRIISLAELTPSDSVLEIGPGLGPLTEHLLASSGKVLAIETDSRLVDFLRERFGPGAPNSEKLQLIHADALDYLRTQRKTWIGWKLVANLPYSVASPILVELAASPAGPERLVATLQSEVAARLMASPDVADYGVLTLLVQLSYVPIESFRIPATCFFPEPEVASSCVCLKQREQPLLDESLRSSFTCIVKQAFSQRRKMMFKLLKARWSADQLGTAFDQTGIDSRARAEQLSLDNFVQLTLRLTQMESAHSRSNAAASRASHAPPELRGTLPLNSNPSERSKTTESAPLQSPTVAQPLISATAHCPASEEIFDVVDEKDQVIEQRPRSEVHRLGLMHRAVHVLVYNRRGEIFLQKRSMTKDRQPGVWDSSSSGHLAPGESYEAAALRELHEEIGLRVERPLKPLFKLPASAETDQEHVWIFRYESEGPFNLEPSEIETGGWFTPTEMSHWMAEHPEQFATAFRLIWNLLQTNQA